MLKRKRNVYFIAYGMMVVSVVVLLVGSRTKSYPWMLGGFCILIAAIVFKLVFYRCPTCGKYLGRFFARNCPRCGEKVD